MSDSIVFHSSWSGPAKDLVLRAIDRHGGWSLWSRLDGVSIGLRSLSGLLPRLKGRRGRFDQPAWLTTYPRRLRTDWKDGPSGPCVATFDRGDVRLVDPSSGQTHTESRAHRRTFRGLRKLRRWSRLDALYFFGYVFASYTAVPFVLPSLRLRGLLSGRWRGQPLQGVRVEYPPGSQVHSLRQAYLFDPTGLLRRNDYVAEVVGAWAIGAHGWDDYLTVNGLPIPTRRTVMPRLGTAVVPFPTVLSATFTDLAVTLT